MKTLKTLIAIISMSLLTSCGVNWHVSTLNYDPIYDDENYIVVSDEVEIDTLNEFQFRNKLRTDFNFRYDFAQYALSQPVSFDWNNRLLGRYNRYNWSSPYYGYYWNRTQMWHDWVWGFTPHRWSPFGYDRWGYNNWMGNAHWGYGWNSYYGWNNYYGWNDWRWGMNNYAWQNRYRSNTVYVNGRRGSSVVSNRTPRTNSNIQENVNRRRGNSNTRTVRSYNNPRINPDNNVIIRDNGETVRIYRRPNDNNNNIRVNPNNNTRNNNWKPRVPNNVNNRPPVINNSHPVRVEQNTRTNYNTNRSTNVRSSNSRSNGNTQIKRNN